ncbi:hypothetical protein Bpfe_018610 [Biomphalaria pfeifferi]|uniref:Uncharacterized protein n=1 Tax=Biomphalaria pfeifferi TaxID=112525 RepID=A0AAD8BCJ4_BIOPF|nr:hypothetical protein Bpfe_018610 [Biomphalaria pfeifferi]
MIKIIEMERKLWVVAFFLKEYLINPSSQGSHAAAYERLVFNVTAAESMALICHGADIWMEQADTIGEGHNRETRGIAC